MSGNDFLGGAVPPCKTKIPLKDGDVVKPPLGVRPEFLFEEERVKDLAEAIIRYVEAGLPPPKCWGKEISRRIELLNS